MHNGLSILLLICLIQSCKTKHPLIPIKTDFGKVSSYAGTCEKAQGFCSGLGDSNGTIQGIEKGFQMKLSKENLSKEFVDNLMNKKIFTVEKDFYISEKLTDRLFEKEKGKKYKLKVKKGKYPVKIKKTEKGTVIVIHFKPPSDVYLNGKYIGKYEWVIIID
ncbi:MAG: hypothetical protein V3V28_00995 [Polaribacter sp.]|uniref:hypothetical protein n=1 Tax=Polaribacter sp. TaxID=1920175 RepID=UPI002F35279C